LADCRTAIRPWDKALRDLQRRHGQQLFLPNCFAAQSIIFGRVDLSEQIAQGIQQHLADHAGAAGMQQPRP